METFCVLFVYHPRVVFNPPSFISAIKLKVCDERVISVANNNYLDGKVRLGDGEEHCV